MKGHMARAALVRIAVFDVDGVLTDGSLIYGERGEELKIFHVQDGLGLEMLRRSGCEVAILSARSSDVVARRMADLGILRVYQGMKDKRAGLLALLNESAYGKSDVAYTGDDLLDLPAMRESGLAIAVANAHPLVRERADWVTTNPGGGGAVREVCELILRARGKLDSIYQEYLR